MALTDEQIEIMEEALVPLFQYLEKEIIADVARRIKKTTTYTRTAELQAMSMRELGYSPAKIRKEAMKLLTSDPNYRKEVAKNTLEYKKEIKKLIAEIVKKAKESGNEIVGNAGEMSWIDDLRVWKDNGIQLTDKSYLNRLVNMYKTQTNGLLTNLTNTTGFKTMSGFEPVMNLYRTELDKAMVKLTTGTFDRETILKQTIKDLAKSGLRSIDYASGKSYQLDTAIRMAMRTSMNQMAAKVSDENLQRTEVHLVYVSKHWGARNKGVGHANHEEWQGKVYYYGQKVPEYKEEAKRIGQDSIDELFQKTGYSVDGSRANDILGLHGINCRHKHHPWFIGASTIPEETPEPGPIMFKGKEYDYYAVTQKMRSMERDVRALKRERDALSVMGMDTQEVTAKIKSLDKEYNQFCKVAKVNPEPARMNYESGTSNLRKTDAWKKYHEMSKSEKVIKESLYIENTMESGTIEAGSSTIASAKKILSSKERSRVIQEAINAPKPFYAEDLRKAYFGYKVKQKEGFYDVLIHGTPHFLEYEHEYILDKETLYYIISGRKDYYGDNIRLLSCSTGKADKYGNCVAQYLADKLKVTVYAPKGELKINPSGELTVGRRNLKEEDGFAKFEPRKG